MDQAILKPPFQQTPISPNGTFSAAWVQHHQDIADLLISIPAAVSLGTITNDDALTGHIGEFLTSVVVGPGLGISNNVALNVTSLPLTAGDWDVRGELWVRIGSGGATQLTAGISQIAGAIPSDPGHGARTSEMSPHTTGWGVLSLAPCRMSLATAGTAFLVAFCTFPSGTCTAYGRIDGRRTR